MGAAAATASAAGSPERGRHTPPGHGKCRDEWKEVSTVIRGISQGARPTAPDPSLPTSNVVFYTDDLQQTHKELAARGVQFPVPPVQQPFGWWSIFEDPDGNRFALVPRGQ